MQFEGFVLDNVWNLDKLNNSKKESIWIFNSKPEALPERIIKASSNENMVISDFFNW